MEKASYTFIFPNLIIFPFRIIKKKEVFSIAWGNEKEIFYQKLRRSSPVEDLILSKTRDLDYVVKIIYIIFIHMVL